MLATAELHNATDVLEGFVRVEKAQMVFPWEKMDVTAGLNLHMEAGAELITADKMAESGI